MTLDREIIRILEIEIENNAVFTTGNEIMNEVNFWKEQLDICQKNLIEQIKKNDELVLKLKGLE